ncbi:hypothetical protein OM076_14630 [Solirubrobacter ginsenosidimutans]|uniref:Uncharacterized protein n=1 Tax=Solirubrobacter ginsenosidimutans TaxID=490573 RepID=A0A9X3MRV7_9ACTN|nr:hypothetical protein [Solirubrobacter ginsenosidimutans]MDA0161509.1 hypothetical protein [Solirubrobacter ginsenosidimutans]
MLRLIAATAAALLLAAPARADVPPLAVDASGTAFGVVPGTESGVAFRLAEGRAPQFWTSPALAQDADALTVPAVKPDGRGGAWLLVNQFAIAHVDAAGMMTKRIPQTAQWVAAPAVARNGDAVLAWTSQRHVVVRHLTAAGAFGPATVMPSRDVYAVALDPRTDDPWVLARATTGLVLQTPGRTVPIRAPGRHTTSLHLNP